MRGSCILAVVLLLASAPLAAAQTPAEHLEALRASLKQARAIANDRERVSALRRIAEEEARAHDRFAILDGEAEVKTPSRDAGGAPMTTEAVVRGADSGKRVSGNGGGIITASLPAGPVGRAVPAIVHHEKIRLSADDVRREMPAPSAAIKARMLPFDINLYNMKIVSANGRADFMERQKTATPEIIFIESGVTTMPLLHATLRQQGVQDALVREGDTYLLKKPLVIGPGAALLIHGKEVADLRLSQEAGSYIVNAGGLFAVDTRITGWNERSGAPAWATAKDSLTFRPFILSWSRSKTYMTGSVVSALGYENSKSYGLSISSGPESVMRFGGKSVGRPQAVLVENSFRNLYFGFYCYEADDAIVIGNEYADNIVYGIDPHDYSNRLLFAYNTVYGSKKKHGIIISREVNDSAIIGNLAFENAGSGIMVERNSIGALVYANTSLDNVQDGLSIYESSCGMYASNTVAGNARMGINVRNSFDVGLFGNRIMENRKAGLHGYSLDLYTAAGQEERNFDTDPYSDVTAFSAVGNVIQANGHGLQTHQMAAFYMRGNRFIDQSPKIAKGEWAAQLPQAFNAHSQQESGMFLTRSCSTAAVFMEQSCRFREAGYFDGDGQSGLHAWMQANACRAQGVTP